jgi:hypothetical protein
MSDEEFERMVSRIAEIELYGEPAPRPIARRPAIRGARMTANRGAKGLPSDVARVLKRAAADEERHYRWAEKSLEQLHAGRRTALGKVGRVVEIANSRTVDMVEEAEKPLMTAMDATRRGVRAAAARPLRAAAVAAAVTGAAGAVIALRRGQTR